jgi:hypothetical protein
LADWPVARRLFAVIAAALVMGLVFGGLRVADAENSASQFGKTEQLAKLGAQLVTVVDDLQNERGATLVNLITQQRQRVHARAAAGHDEQRPRPGQDQELQLDRERWLPRHGRRGRGRR